VEPWAGVVFDTTDRPVPLSFASTPAAGTRTAVPAGVVRVSGLVLTWVAFITLAKVTTTSVPSLDTACGKTKDAFVPVPVATVRLLPRSTAFHVVL
jgi:hypothetical protein